MNDYRELITSGGLCYIDSMIDPSARCNKLIAVQTRFGSLRSILWLGFPNILVGENVGRTYSVGANKDYVWVSHSCDNEYAAWERECIMFESYGDHRDRS